MKILEMPQAAKKSAAKSNRILVPLDFSGAAGGALSYAVALAKHTRAKIVLLHVIEPYYPGIEPGLGYMPAYTEADLANARKQMRHIAAEYIPRGLFAEALVQVGSPFHQITHTAKSINAGLIILTTHGRTGLSHLLMGSTAERVVRHAPCPVLTLRQSAQATPLPLPPRQHARGLPSRG